MGRVFSLVDHEVSAADADGLCPNQYLVRGNLGDGNFLNPKPSRCAEHGGGLFTLYAHLSQLDVDRHQPVEAGAVLGLSGSTGRVTGPHLHWGAKIGSLPFDPTALLDAELFR